MIHCLFFTPSYSKFIAIFRSNSETRPGQTLVWNVENRLHSVAGEQYLYDENGIRIKKTVGATTTFYPFGHYEVSGTTVKKYYTFGGMTVAMRTGSTLQYLHTDHLGGVAAVTTSAGVYSTNQSYFAYGKKRAGGTLPTTINYTGQKQDASGLVYMNVRYYDPLVGMFISPDTIVPDAGVLIDYNRFAYARANPLRYIDSSGNTPWDVVDAIFWALSARDMYNNPGWKNAGWLALDTATLLPIVPAVGGYIRRGPEAAKIANQASKLIDMHGVDIAKEFLHVAHKPGAHLLLKKLINQDSRTVKGALFELEYAVNHSDEIVDIGRLLENSAEIDFVLEGNIFVNAKHYTWSDISDFMIEVFQSNDLKQAQRYMSYGSNAVKYVFKGSVPDSYREALEAIGVIVEVEE